MNPEKPNRIASIDILRGAIMAIMVLDHVRDFFLFDGISQNPLDFNTTSTGLFLTRWITHFCAPLFVFLSGISAFLSVRGKAMDGSFLIKRGLWLMFAEVTIVTLGITFNPFFNVIVLQVIWAIGCSLVILGLMIRLPRWTILTLGFVLVLGHNALDYVETPVAGLSGFITQLLITSRGAFVNVGGNYFIAILYAVLPWTGVMLLGFCAGSWFQSSVPAETRKKYLLLSGVFVLGLFLILRFMNEYGDPLKWEPQATSVFTCLSFINVSKYPPSLLYCCLMIGPGLIILSLTEKSTGGLARILTTFGRVPFFYYLLHFYLIHIVLIVLFFASGYGIADVAPPGSPFLFRPFKFGYSMPIMYLIWLSVVASLYFPCQWYWKYKKGHPEKWISRYV